MRTYGKIFFQECTENLRSNMPNHLALVVFNKNSLAVDEPRPSPSRICRNNQNTQKKKQSKQHIKTTELITPANTLKEQLRMYKHRM